MRYVNAEELMRRLDDYIDNYEDMPPLTVGAVKEIIEECEKIEKE